MDIYRFFHPHHNPRLRRTALRLQELSELEHAACELRRALERAQQRAIRHAKPPIMAEHFTDVIKASRFIEASLQTLCEAHPGDTSTERSELVSERTSSTGWETWTQLFKAPFGPEDKR